MKKIVKWFNWELNNEFLACGYFAVMLIMYCIIELIFGIKEVSILIIFEMFLVNYFLSTIQKLVLDIDKGYSKKTFLFRAIIFCVASVIITIVVSSFGGWFEGMPLWAGILIYSMLILSYITVWVIFSLGKKYDTRQLNEQLANFKRNTKQE